VNYLDLLILILPLLGAWSGFKKGFVLEIFSLLALFGGLYAAVHFSDFATDYLRENHQFDQKWLPALGFGLTFLAVSIGIHLIGRLVDKAIDIASLSIPNKLAGTAIGAFRSIIILGVFVLVYETLFPSASWPSKELKDTSLLYPHLREFVFNLIPKAEDIEWMEAVKDLVEPAGI
jgi:membrane protein required for colicin V production